MTPRLDIHADVICPWCLIGKLQLEQALAEAGRPVFDIHWQPFLLDPEMPATGRDHAGWLEAQFGSRAEAARQGVEVTEAAQAAGMSIDLGAIRHIPNPIDAHRLIHWAGLEGRQGAVVDALFRAHFQQGRDIGDHEVLTHIAEAAGMDPALTMRLLVTDADLAETRGRAAYARARGIGGAPTFVIAQTHVLPGAQPLALWRQVVAEITGQQPPPERLH